jgi:hypothetical protein
VLLLREARDELGDTSRRLKMFRDWPLFASSAKLYETAN